MKPDNADVFKPRQTTPPTKQTKSKSSVGQVVKTIVFAPFMFVAALIFARRLGK